MRICQKIFSMIISFCMIVSIIPMSATAMEKSVSEKVEQELISLIEKYGEDNIIFEDGIVLDNDIEGNTIDIIDDEGIIWTSNNEEIVSIVDTKINTHQGGTTFLVGEKDSKYHLVQTYVNDKTAYKQSNYSSLDRAGSQYVVYLDAGHGGKDPGASANGIVEKDLNLTLALKTRALLEEQGIKVIMSRTDDRFVALADISASANNAKPDIFISIHQNSFTSSGAYGIETYYNKTIDKQLAQTIQNNLIKNTGAYDRGARFGDLHVVRETKMPAALVECGFLTNKNDSNNLKSEAYLNKITKAIANGAVEYLKANITLTPLMGERIFAQNRYTTSIEIFNKGWSNSDTVILVDGVDYPDALCASPLAGKYNAPILLLDRVPLKNQQELINSLKNKKVKNAIIIGGTNAISSNTESDLSNMGITSKRIGGNDRYETSVLIAKELGEASNEIVVTYGLNFADSLSMASVAGLKGIPMLLTDKDNLPSSVKSYVNEKKPSKTYIIGATGVVSQNVANQLPNVERIGGSNRYDTNRKVYEKFKGELNISNIYVASGTDFPDALSGSALAKTERSFLLLVNPASQEPITQAFISTYKPYISKAYILGGSSAISKNALNGIGISIEN